MNKFFETSEFPEASSRVGFSTNPLIRDSENRNEHSLPDALASKDVKFHLYAGQRVIVRKDAHPTALFDRIEAEAFKPKFDKAVLLGMAEDGPRVGVGVGIDAETLADPYQLYDFRALLYTSSVDPADVGAIAQGGELLYWNRMNRFCGKCGNETQSALGGYRRDCGACDNKIFPRTDPVVIMLAIKDDKCLLGRSPHFPPDWYSTLAGFVEHGETLEDAVRRETLEESGIHIRKVKYFASQPWPFPHSLMIGAHCEAISDDIAMDDSELEDCRWFSRDEVKLMIRDEHPEGFKCPPNKAISSAIIMAWAED